jgi:DNA-binding PadR family transcriptional regulator
VEKDRKILQLFPSLNPFGKVSGNSKEGMNSCLEVLRIVAIKGNVTQYDLTKKTKYQPNPLKHVETARASLKKLDKLGLLKVQQRPGKKGRPRKESSLTAKGVIACLVFSELQKTDWLEILLKSSQFQGDKLAALLRIYNEGYAERVLFPKKPVVSPCLDIAKRLISQEGLNVELVSEEKLLLKLRSVVDEEFLAIMRKKQSVDEWILMSLQNSSFIEDLAVFAGSSKGLGPEDLEQGMKIGIHYVLVMSSPELLAWMVLQQRKRADIQQTMKRFKDTITARAALNSNPFEGPQDILDRSLDALRDLMLEELSQMNDK